MNEQGWRRVRFGLLGRLMDPHRPHPWRWRVVQRKGRRRRLELKSAHGRRWEFKMSGGCWIRPKRKRKGNQ